MAELTRRTAIGTIATVAMASVVSASDTAISASPVLAFAGQHKPVQLRFNPAKLVGLSEKLIQSHWENNYQGSVKALNMIEGRLASAMADKDFPAVAYGGLKREQLHRTGSVVLHELYFGALGGDGVASGDIMNALAMSYGSYGAWEAEFRRTAMSLAGGSGWCVLAFDLHSGSLHNYWAWDHMHQPATGIPLLTLDMYEHSYHMDYGSAAAKYVDAFMLNVDWAVVDARYRAVKAVALDALSA
ncbi:Fe-Mn family superoxide dismutase [Sphingorhabdus sp.]|uniref:superoxide dismutase n=1 Tax=Sphingorhabdus sp. TaxID=1902408 RepID=UPI0032B81E64